MRITTELPILPQHQSSQVGMNYEISAHFLSCRILLPVKRLQIIGTKALVLPTRKICMIILLKFMKIQLHLGN